MKNPMSFSLTGYGHLPVAEGVMLQFQVIYRQMHFCHHGMKRNDPEHLLSLHGELIAVADWHRDGSGLAN